MAKVSLECDHDRGIYDFRELDKRYFDKKCLNKPNYPVKCSGTKCGKHFVNNRKKVFEGGATI